MLSVLLPLYQNEIEGLIAQLARQLEASGVDWEIVLRDDASGDLYYSQYLEISKHEKIRLVRNEENQGRARTRNLLAGDARYPYLLFIDGDSVVDRADLIARYLELAGKYPVVYGGRAYPADRPDRDHLLRWAYGRKYESSTPNFRNSRPYLTLGVNNLLVEKRVIQRIPFDEEIRLYGYEDSLWAADIEGAGIEVFHIDNPVLYPHPEANTVYLEKTETALENLRALVKRKRFPKVKLVRYSRPLEWSRSLLRPVYAGMARYLKRWIVRKPSVLGNFQLYKFVYYLSLR